MTFLYCAQTAEDIDTISFAYDSCLRPRSNFLVSDTRKFDRGLRQLRHVDLHWLDLPERVKFKLMSMVHKQHNCLNSKAPRYLMDNCIPISDVAIDIFVLPDVITSLCLDTVSARMGVGHLLLPAQLLGTH